MSINAKSGCGRGKNKYVKEIHFLHRSASSLQYNAILSNICRRPFPNTIRKQTARLSFSAVLNFSSLNNNSSQNFEPQSSLLDRAH